MTEPELNIDDDSSGRDEEDAMLKAGYAGILHQRYPFHPTDTASFNDENSYVLSLEKEYLDIPPNLEFGRLFNSIPEEHRSRLKDIWKLVENNYFEYLEICEDLEQKWTTGVPIDQLGEFSERIVKDSKIMMIPELKNGVRAIVEKSSEKRELRTWKREEKALRKSLYDVTKKYIVSLRLYYEMLLESNPEKRGEDKENEDYVLPKDHQDRDEIVERNRYLRYIDAAHQGIAIGKAAHHGQEKGRMRKTEKLPYIIHGMDVSHATSLDVLPYTLDRGMANLAVIIALVGPIHDVIEDTDLKMEDLFGSQGYLKRLTDAYDSSLDPKIKSGFPTPDTTRDKIKEKVLNLLKPDVFKIVQEVLRLVSHNSQWTDQEKAKAVQQSIPGKETTMKILGITPEKYKGWKADKPDRSNNTFFEFPEETEEKENKSTAFLMRINAMHGVESRQVALIIKLEDRANNILSLDKMKPEKQRSMLRSTTSRVIAWAMLDHDNKNYPLYNALPRCIDTTLKGYEKFMASNPEAITDLDRRYIAELEQWQIDVKRFVVPSKIIAVLKRNRELKSKESQAA
ncbi:MAG: hypothetical protein NTZ25_05995 [Candidatus Peregrinibacteria bacterium]|nr:hypothetical protein [Candidatus Peregrinibacteria bacterium]